MTRTSFAVVALLCLAPISLSAQQERPYVHTYVGDPGSLPAEPVLDSSETGNPGKPLPRLSDEAAKDIISRLPAEDAINRRAARNDKAPKEVNLAELVLDNSQVSQVTVNVMFKGAPQKPLQWVMSPLDVPVFIRKLSEKKEVQAAVPTSPSKTGYAGLHISMLSPEGRSYGPITVYHDAIEIDGTPHFLQDRDRDLEFWTFGTLKSFDDRDRVISLLSIYTFEECVKLGHVIVESVPRQCITPEGTTFLDTGVKFREKDKKINDFDSCISGKHPIINSFPRKCVAPGGRLYVEPPRLK